MQDGGGGAGAEGSGGGGNGMQQLLAILADGEEQARRLGELPLADGGGDYRGAARRLHCTLGRAVAVARAVEAASASTDRSSDSPRSADESSGRTATAAGDAQERQAGLLCKRRKGLPRWTAKFRVPDANLEATPDDGLSWRKYGQKDILGAKFPRGYYRCTYRNAQGCPATKQVQRSDADLCVFDVTYQGEHTCHQRHRHHGATPSTTTHSPQQEQEHPAAAPGMQHVAMGFKGVDVLKVETTSEAAARALHGHCHDGGGPSFCFPSVPFAHHAAGEAGPAEALISFSPSGSGYGFSAAAPPRSHCPCPVVVGGSYDDVYDNYARRQQAPPGAESSSELAEVVSRATAPAPASGFDYASLYQYHQAELDPHLPFPPFGGAGPSHGPYQ